MKSPGWTRWTRRVATALALVGPLVGGSPRANAQSSERPSTVLQAQDAALLVAGTAGSAALTLLDTRIAHAFSDTAFHRRHPGFKTAANRASLVTETALMITGGLTYGIARLRNDDGTADVALHTTESVAVAAAFIQVIRGALGRARPYVIDETGEKINTDPYDFQPLHGFTSYNYRSWPSMHAMASFAAATALAQEMRRRDTPHRGLITPALYVGAAMPALARMYLDEHWASDVAMGVFLGVFSGQRVVTYSHDHPTNRVDRTFLHARMSIGPAGANFSLSPF